jgi:ATP-dependent DNA ligase
MIAPTLPTHDELRQNLARLESQPGSVILIAVEYPRETQNFCRVSTGFFDADERKALRAALTRCKKTREAGKA